jgi:hypothetical protein
MKKQKYRLILDFDLNLAEGEKLDKHSLTSFKNQAYNFCHKWDGYFYAYFDGKDGAYDTDIIPVNVKSKLIKRKK